MVDSFNSLHPDFCVVNSHDDEDCQEVYSENGTRLSNVRKGKCGCVMDSVESEAQLHILFCLLNAGGHLWCMVIVGSTARGKEKKAVEESQLHHNLISILSRIKVFPASSSCHF